jgi:nitroimidazol reductase NimA-like FMN-containing flavoprotein (pyridoxamine 5'-phosphate oxidase superfamily)
MPRDYNLGKNTPTAHQRLPEYARDDEWIRAFLQRGQIAHIASRWDLQPFIIPTIFYYDQAGHRLIFHSNIAGRIRANIERHPEVCAESARWANYYRPTSRWNSRFNTAA